MSFRSRGPASRIARRLVQIRLRRKRPIPWWRLAGRRSAYWSVCKET